VVRLPSEKICWVRAAGRCFMTIRAEEPIELPPPRIGKAAWGAITPEVGMSVRAGAGSSVCRVAALAGC